MIDNNPRPPAPEGAPARDAGTLLLAAGGLAAAFGAASCCALPMLFASLGLGSAWLVAIAWFAAPHRVALLAVALAYIAGSGGLLLWRRGAAACALDGSCARSPTATALGTGILSIAAVLAVLGFVFV